VWGSSVRVSGKTLDKTGKTLDYWRGTPRESPADLQQKTIAHKKTLEEILGFYKEIWCS
jgi:hypothetical protein